MTKAELIEQFDEHVFYEVQMLIYTKQCLEKEQPQPVWNAMFAAFNVSARNLENFLSNKGNNTRLRVLDYDPYRKVSGKFKNEPIRKALEQLNAQCLHLGKSRTPKPDDKINIVKIRKIFTWVVSSMDSLLKNLKDDFRPQSDWTGLLSQKLTVRVGPQGPSATNVTSTMTTGPTGGLGEMIGFDTHAQEIKGPPK
jgi:hypothetical protein